MARRISRRSRLVVYLGFVGLACSEEKPEEPSPEAPSATGAASAAGGSAETPPEGGGTSGPGPSNGGSGGTLGAGGSEASGLRGAFLQVLNAPSAEHFAGAVEKMAELKFDTAILQTESYLTSEGERNAVLEENLRAVLDAAGDHELRVFVGLVLPEYGNGSLTHAKDPEFVDTVVSASQTSIDLVMQRFGDHPAFFGWYLPLELWTPSTEGLFELPRYVEEVSQAAKLAKDLPVLISPFISDLATSPEPTQDLIEVLGSSVDYVALQDGVGARGLGVADLETKVKPYAQAVISACATTGCAAWMNVEAFTLPSEAAPTERFLGQLDLALELHIPAVSYEFSNYFLDGSGTPNALFLAVAERPSER